MSRSIACHPSQFATEEVANQATHAIGFLLSLPAGWWLLRAARDQSNDWLTLGCAIYAFTQSLMYAASALSHSFHRGKWRHRFRTLDQVCIFLFIAGSYTPFGLTFRREGWWGLLLAAVWGLAVTGAGLKIFRTRIHNVSTAFYVFTASLPVIAMPELVGCIGLLGAAWAVLGGAAYFLGLWFFHNDEHRYFHCAWHLLVMLGSLCHYVLMLNYLVPAA
jgi:hemolysin III